MILNNIQIDNYKSEFKKRFENFGDKAPIVISFWTDDNGITVIHENSSTTYHYDWDYSVPVKSLIKNIKEDLSYAHYPRLVREVEETVKLTTERQSEMIADGVSVDDIPEVEVVKKTIVYRIDKCIMMKDEMVLIDEATGEQYLYKLNSNSAFFLKNYRDGKWKDPIEAGDYFFNHAVLINNLSKK